MKNGSPPFSVSWVLTDTTFTIKNLQNGDVDVGITYSPAAEKIAAEQGIIDPKIYYLFRDHFLITGPNENPAKINGSADVYSIMAQLFQSADKNSANTSIPTRWLSRYDKSATNIKESSLWLGIGQVSNNYHVVVFPKLTLSGSMVDSVLHVVSPIHCLSHSGLDDFHCAQRVHAHGPGNLPITAEASG